MTRGPTLLFRPLNASDIDLLWYWHNNPLVPVASSRSNAVSKALFGDALKRLKGAGLNLTIILSDNIRVGAVFKKKRKRFYALSPFAYPFGYLSRRMLGSLNMIDANRSDVSFINEFRKHHALRAVSEITAAVDEPRLRLTRDKKHILILGPDRRNANIIAYLQARGHSVDITSERVDARYVESHKIDFLISSGYAHKVPLEIVERFPGSVINLHATFLPWGKGIGTTFFSFLLGQPIGISIHLIDGHFDTGALICRKLLIPDGHETTRTYHATLLAGLDRMFQKSWPKIETGQIRTHSQQKFGASPPYFSRLDFEKVIEKLPQGYDTSLADLSVMGIIDRSSQAYFNEVLSGTVEG